MREGQSDNASRRQFLKAAVAAGSGLAVVPTVGADKSAVDNAATATSPAEHCVTLEAPASWTEPPIDVKPLEFLPDHPLPGLSGTSTLTWTGDLSVRMMDGAHRYTERKIGESVETRQRHWKRDFSSRAAYETSVEPNRKRFAQKIGIVDARLAPFMERFGDYSAGVLVAEGEAYQVCQVRWPVLENVLGLGSVHGEGLLLEPRQTPVAYVVALPDANQTPEQLVGLSPGLDQHTQFARRLAEAGCLVVIPTLVDRSSQWSGHAEYSMTGQTNREWIYRQAFHMGRHIIGYEVQKVLAAVDWFHTRGDGARIAVAGYGEGGLIAFYAAALDTRIGAALVSGYFDSRQRVWSEPIDRNVWGLLEEFGDAELATLVAPRALIVEFSRGPEASGEKGDLAASSYESVAAEFHRIDTMLKPGFQSRQLISGPGGQFLGPGSPAALQAFLSALDLNVPGLNSPVAPPGALPHDRRPSFRAADRQKRQVRELEAHVQSLVRNSEHAQEEFFLYRLQPGFADRRWTTQLRFEPVSPAHFIDRARWYREYFWTEVLGKFDEPYLPPNPRSRKIYDTEKWTGYEVVLDVWEDVFAWGILLVPKDVKPGERRPVVVCQHGRGSVPVDVVENTREGESYHQFAARLAERGFVTFAPHNLYRGEDRYRWLSRKANGVKASLFSFIIAQHDQILRWLATLSFVDRERIAFYGLSYGGETAVRVPSILERYCLSICAGDFNHWTPKVAATDEWFSFMYSIEWEMPYFNMGSTFDYAEMAYLIFPRPFMAERGHHDQVSRDRLVAYEYAKVLWLYTQFGLAGRTQMEYFNGGHAINGQGTFEFLATHLA
ncbi:MAG TPA: dienelactone hydrolase family protein [Terriglobia bacterium]|nr:dienelactone hydrolase family protein [Terriglobia bacterium]